MKILQRGSFLFFLWIPFSVVAQEGSLFLIDGVGVVIGSQMIKQSDMDKQIIQYAMQSGQIEEEVARCEVLEKMMLDKLLIHQAKLDSITPKESEIKAQVEQRLQYILGRVGSKENLESFYKKSLTVIKAEMHDQISQLLTAQRMQQKIISDANVSPYDVRKFYDAMPLDSFPQVDEQVRLLELKKKLEPSDEARQEAIDRLTQIKEDVLAGASFKSKAVLYSQDPGSISKGGLYENVRRGQFVKEFEAVAFNLWEGDISDPFLTKFGYHIVQVLRRKGNKIDLRHILIKPVIDAQTEEYAINTLDSLRKLLVSDQLTFDQASKFLKKDTYRTDQNQSEEKKVDVKDLSREVHFAIKDLEERQISDPVREEDERSGDQTITLYKIIRKIPKHQADYQEDFLIFKNLALQESRKNILDSWISEKRKRTYIWLGEEASQCDFAPDWKGQEVAR